MRAVVGLLVVSSAVWLAASTSCGCAGVGIFRIVPSEPTIFVGQSFTAEYQEGGICTPSASPKESDYHTVPMHWKTTDTLIVSVDSMTGTIRGLAVGNATVRTSTGLPFTVHVR